MTYYKFLPLADTCQLLTVLLSLLAYCPQWITLWRNKSSNNISGGSWLIWTGSGLLAWVYAFISYQAYGSGIMLLISSTAALLFLLITVTLVIAFRPISNGNKVVQAPLEYREIYHYPSGGYSPFTCGDDIHGPSGPLTSC